MHLKPGPQPENQIAGTFEEQLLLATAPRRPEEAERARILDLIAEPLGEVVQEIVQSQSKTRQNGP